MLGRQAFSSWRVPSVAPLAPANISRCENEPSLNSDGNVARRASIGPAAEPPSEGERGQSNNQGAEPVVEVGLGGFRDVARQKGRKFAGGG
jgi:hypothetical protein